MPITIDLPSLDAAQLVALKGIIPDQILQEEVDRRDAYENINEGLSELAQAALDLRGVLDNLKKTAAIKAVKDSGILVVVRRLLKTADVNGIEFDTPVLKVVEPEPAAAEAA